MDYSQWWANHLFGNYDESLSILDLVNAGTMDCKLAGLLWTLMENRTSIVVASGPVFAGKSTLLHALLDFLPPDSKTITLRGYYEDFQFVSSAHPENTCLIAEEISNHGFEEYVWGIQALRTIRLLAQGYILGSTMHGRNSEEVIYILHKILGIPLALISRLGIIVNLSVTPGRNYFENEPIRRIGSVDLILPHPEGLAIQTLAAQTYTEKGFEYQTEEALQKALIRKNLIGKYCLTAEMDRKKRFLKHALRKGKTSRKEVRRLILEYYRSKSEPYLTIK
jgi:hypothetical protein